MLQENELSIYRRFQERLRERAAEYFRGERLCVWNPHTGRTELDAGEWFEESRKEQIRFAIAEVIRQDSYGRVDGSIVNALLEVVLKEV
jgi:hypothetical protein